jgi:hypothetical protein
MPQRQERSLQKFLTPTYDSMTDLKASTTLNESEVNKLLSDLKKLYVLNFYKECKHFSYCNSNYGRTCICFEEIKR